MSAFRHALASGCDGFELDIRITADGRLLCVHDAVTGQLTVAACDYGTICNQYFRLRPVDTEPLPLLEQVLQEFGDSAFLDIELKVAGLEKNILELLNRYAPKRFVVSSFMAEALLDLAELNASVPLGFIFDDVAGLRAYHTLPVKYVIPHHDLLTRELVETFHREEKKVFTWTVNRAREMTRLAGWGVDGLISDDPALLRRTILRN